MSTVYRDSNSSIDPYYLPILVRRDRFPAGELQSALHRSSAHRSAGTTVLREAFSARCVDCKVKLISFRTLKGARPLSRNDAYSRLLRKGHPGETPFGVSLAEESFENRITL